MPLYNFNSRQEFSTIDQMPDFRSDEEKVNSPLSIYNHQNPDIAYDWYKILRQGHHDEDDDIDEKCAGFNFTGCKGPKDDDYVKPYRKVYDPVFHDHEE